MTLIATQTLGVTGTAPSFAAAAAGDTANVGDGVSLYLEVRNSDASSHTVTLATPGNLATGDAFPDRVYTVGATTGEVRIPLLKEYRDATDGLAHITYSATTGMTRAVVSYR